jgi:hypothetical protein
VTATLIGLDLTTDNDGMGLTAGVPVCTITLGPGIDSTGSCLLGATAVAVGVYRVSMTYVPAAKSSTNANYYYTPSTAVSLGTLTVERDPTTMTVSESPTSVSVGSEQKALFTVNVRSFNSKNVPNGETVTVSVGSGGVHCTATLTAGVGTCNIGGSQIACTATGNAYPFAVSATYPGDADFVGSSAVSTHELLVIPLPKSPPCV